MSTSLTPGDATDLQGDTGADLPSMHITQAQAYSYRVPKASASRSRLTNYLVLLKGTTTDGRQIEGLGEGQPRSWRTGDDAGDSWQFLEDAVGLLYNQRFSTADAAGALRQVRAAMQRVSERADLRAASPDYEKPFRGSMLGVEVALLDLLAKARNETLAQLLGQKRDSVALAPPAISPTTAFRVLQRKVNNQGNKYEYIRLTAAAGLQENLDLLTLAARADRSQQAGQSAKPLWLDLNGSLTPEEATQLLQDIADAVDQGTLPPQVMLEQPVPVTHRVHLGVLQQQADEAARNATREAVDIRIVGDESVSDVDDVEQLRQVGGVGGINIRPAQAGGLLASIDLAEETLAADPDAKIFLTRMIGASRITASSLRHLALALPRIDAAVVSSVVERTLRISHRVKTEQERAERQRAVAKSAVAQQLESRPGAEPSPAISSLQVISNDMDDDIDPDDPVEVDDDVDSKPASEEADEPGPQRHEDSVKGAPGKAYITADDAEIYRETDPVRRFRVRDVPGLGMDLRFSGLVSEVRKAVSCPAGQETTYHGIPVTQYDDVDDLHPLGPNGSKGHLLEREALALGLNTTRYSKGAFTATDGESEPVPFKWSRNPLSSAASLALCTHKEATRMQLQQAGVPVPAGRTFARGDYATAKEFVNRIGYPVVVKPSMGVRGIGVVAGIQDEEQLDAALKLMAGSRLGDQDFIVEKHVHGADYRIVVIGDEVIAAIQREPASVLGDGTSTIGELLIAKNIARKRNPHLWARPAKYDDAARHELEKSGRSLDTVLPKGERQLLANTCSLSQGGDSIDVLDEMHPSIKEASVAAVKAMPGLYFCGVDFLLEDHTKPLNQQDAGICELNAHAAIGNCEYPMFGTGRPVAKTMMRAAVDRYGLKANAERADQVALHLTIRGRVTGVNFRNWLRRRADISGVSGWVRNVNRRTVEAVLVGPTDPTTAVAAATILGPQRAVPTAYEARHIPFPEELNGFEVREDAPQGTPVEAIDAK